MVFIFKKILIKMGIEENFDPLFATADQRTEAFILAVEPEKKRIYKV
jgi:hypothetical protein